MISPQKMRRSTPMRLVHFPLHPFPLGKGMTEETEAISKEGVEGIVDALTDKHGQLDLRLQGYVIRMVFRPRGFRVESFGPFAARGLGAPAVARVRVLGARSVRGPSRYP